ncbi:type I DNA topoisomerase [bacterium]|nr:type I DNA topoisomerase [bacterium]
MKNLIIVESPTKAKTISKYFGSRFKVIASMGHIRDLPEKELGIDIENHFKPKYVVLEKKRKILQELKKEAADAETIFLAADSDREGEAICWHIASELGGKDMHRLLFHEITKEKLEEALAHPTKIDMQKVDAQQARRLLDRLVGYKVSPLLGNKVQRGLSAGRVQSVSLRLIVERELEIEAFVPEEYWTITALLSKNGQELSAKLTEKNGKKIKIQNKEETEAILSELSGKDFVVQKVTKKLKKRSPSSPFITSKLQQEAFSKLGFAAKKTMSIAQQLYEGIDVGGDPVGLITYMRTDSVRVSDEAVAEARVWIEEGFSKEYLSEKQRVFTNKNKAQDAHEAVRPTSCGRNPEGIKGHLTADQFKLYNLVFKKFVSSQMADAKIMAEEVEIACGDYTFSGNGSTLLFDGYLKVWTYDLEKDKVIPELSTKDILSLIELSPKQNFTVAVPRYTEGTLIKCLEENGIGRPSTYAAIVSVIFNRSYVEKDEGKIKPTELGKTVWGLLQESFPELFEVKFTARMEEDLDKIEEGEKKWLEILDQFWGPFSLALSEAKIKMRNIKKEAEKPTDIVCDKCGANMVIKPGRFGEFLACPNFPKCRNTRALKEEKRVPPEETDKICPKCSSALVIRTGRTGRFIACKGYPKCKYTEPILKIPCPRCKEGILIFRTSKRGSFYGCSKYPNCDYTTRGEFLEETCPHCKKNLIKYKERVFCVDCNYTKEKEG